ANGRTAPQGRTIPAVIPSSSVMLATRTALPKYLGNSQALLLSCRRPTGTDCSAAIYDKALANTTSTLQADLVSVATMVSSAVAAVLNFMSIFIPHGDIILDSSRSITWESLC